MAHHKSAEKRNRRNTKRFKINHSRKSRIRTFIKKVEAAVRAGNYQEANENFHLAQPEIARGVTKGVLHKNTASRKISRLNKSIRALVA